jgi:hypothetical protein
MIILLIFVLIANELSYSRNRNANVPIIKYEFGNGAGYYDYAPSAIQDQYGIRYVFVCQNKDPFKIVDHIYLFKGIPTKYGYSWQHETEILAPSESGWDHIHVCDPDVREFKLTYKGETYNWIMTYLGVDRWDCKHNQIGLAFSKNIEGPYIKYDKNPIVSYPDTLHWGVGQSTTIVLDNQNIDLFYSKNGAICVRKIKLDKLDSIKVMKEKTISFLQQNSYPAYSKKYIYAVSEIRINESQKIPTWVGNYIRFVRKPISKSLFSSTNNWTQIGLFGPKETRFPRNHNPGLLTDSKGYMLSDNKAIIYFTTAVTGEDWLWSYDIYSATFDLSKYK